MLYPVNYAEGEKQHAPDNEEPGQWSLTKSFGLAENQRAQNGFDSRVPTPHAKPDNNDSKSKTGPQCEPIAIVGMACRLPGGASSPSKLWDLLIEGRSGHCQVPSDRFKIESFYHPDPGCPGSTNATGGYYLKENIRAFENQFFGINNREAMSMDPQQRKLLEIVYECLESGGQTLEAISGANVGCYVGNFTADFMSMQLKDPELFTRYSATGMGTTILANRLSHVFNLKGPSVVLDTACSSSLYCLHTASVALDSRECDAAIMAGVNLIQAPEHHLAIAKAGILSGTSICNTFDASADGYGRADGVGALYLKRLSDAIRDGDPIRSVIRATAVNSNGHTTGITLPSVDGQEAVIRKAYTKAQLRANETDYVECHGTGTAVGDPIEIEALARVFCREKMESPLFVGSVKTNLGHSEAASGITSIIKTTLALEKSMIPATIGIQNLNPSLKLKERNIQVVTTMMPWPRNSPKRPARASVNSFGYGGANAHVILESAAEHIPRELQRPVSAGSRQKQSLYLLPFSASNSLSLKHRVESLSTIRLDNVSLADLSYILGSRRSHLPVRGYLLGDVDTWRSFLKIENLHTADSNTIRTPLPYAFVFSGQGSQWPQMARQLIEYYPTFERIIHRLDHRLAQIPNSPSWTIYDTINEPAATSKIHCAAYSQPVCTAVQIGLVELLFEWNIMPEIVIGHSSGEIGAAYAAGHLTSDEAILIAYYRGLALTEMQSEGAMLAAGLGQEDAKSLIEDLGLREKICVACINSPESVTISGDADSIDALCSTLQTQGVFARKLRTDGRAYHSHHVTIVGDYYERLVATVLQGHPVPSSRVTKVLTSQMISSVTSKLLGADVTRTPNYWRLNMEKPVLFSAALEEVASRLIVSHLVEIGPHSTLKLPIHQTLTYGGHVTYSSTLSRGENAVESILRFVGNLYLCGQNIPFTVINNLSENQRSQPNFLSLNNLPAYRWHYDSSVWVEPRLSEEFRNRQYPRHPLLGTPVVGELRKNAMWRNSLRIENVQWLQDHRIEQSIVFPAAGYLNMVVEALRQATKSDHTKSTVLFHRVDILKALTLSEEDTVELFTELSPGLISNTTVSRKLWHFSISSNIEGEVTTHARGSVGIEAGFNLVSGQFLVSNSLEHETTHKVYERLNAGGFSYGPKFQTLENIRYGVFNGRWQAVTEVHLRRKRGAESKLYFDNGVQPIMIDALLQTGLIAAAASSALGLPACVPTSIERAEVSAIPDLSAKGVIYADARQTGFGSFIMNTTLCDEHNNILIEFRGVRMVNYPGLSEKRSAEERHPIMRVLWKVDATTLKPTDKEIFTNAISHSSYSEPMMTSTKELKWLAGAVALLSHKTPTLRILELANDFESRTEIILDTLRAQTSFQRFQTYTLGSMTSSDVISGCRLYGELATGVSNTKKSDLGLGTQFDLFILPTAELTNFYLSNHLEKLRSFAAAGAILLFVANIGQIKLLETQSYSVISSAPLDSSDSICMTRISEVTKTERNLLSSTIVIIRGDGGHSLEDLLYQKLTEQTNLPITQIPLHQVSVNTIPHGAVVVAAVELKRSILATMKDFELRLIRLLFESASIVLWITGGNLFDGKNPNLALYSGLSRSVMLEQPTSKLLSLDIDDALDDSTIVDHVLTVLEQAICSPAPDYEYLQHKNGLYISRFVPDEVMNESFRKRQEAKPSATSIQTSGHCQLAVSHVGRIDTIYFKDVSKDDVELDSGFVEVWVQCVGLNAKDAYALAGKVDTINATCTLEYCGIISRIGSGIKDLAVGDRVVVVAPGYFKTYEHVPARVCFKLREKEDFAVMSTLFVAYMTALYAFRDRSNLQPGESVLIHSAAGGVGIAAIQIAKLAGANIFATVGTQAKKQFLIDSFGLKEEQIFSSRDSSFLKGIQLATHGCGVDVVLNSLTGDLLHDSWRACSALGRFVEIGKRDILDCGKLDMEVFKRSTTFTAFDLSDLFHSTNPAHHRVLKRLASKVLQLYRAGDINAIQPLKIFDISNIEPAFRYFLNSTRTGKVAISLECPASLIQFCPAKYSTALSPTKSYIMVGCLGGLGRSLSKWMLDRGARNYVFIGRSGVDKPAAKQLVLGLEAAGAVVSVVKGDVTCPSDVQEAISQAPSPIGGVIQAAMGLNEALFSQMSSEYWHTGIDPKVLGTWNLHKALETKDSQLDFFVMTSSVAGSIGTATESNYCAANHFLDNFARYRRKLGLPATSIGLGMVSEVGYLHEHPEIEALLLRKGIRPINEDELLRIFDLVLSGNTSSFEGNIHFADSHILTGLEATGLQAQRKDGFDGHRQVIDDPRASILLQSFNKKTPQPSISAAIPGSGPSSEILDAFRSGGNVKEIATRVIAKKMSNLVLLSTEQLDPQKPLAEFGMDSMLAAELRSFLFRVAGVDVPFQVLMGSQTCVRSLAEMVTGKVGKGGTT